MSRANIRRKKKQKIKTPTYNLTKDQLNAIVKGKVKDEFAKVEQEATEDAINTAMILMLTLPLEVLMDHYWQKSYVKRIPEFTNYVLEYYCQWENGELDMDKLRDDLWVYGGVRIEKKKQRRGVVFDGGF